MFGVQIQDTSNREMDSFRKDFKEGWTVFPVEDILFPVGLSFFPVAVPLFPVALSLIPVDLRLFPVARKMGKKKCEAISLASKRPIVLNFVSPVFSASIPLKLLIRK